MGRSCSIAPGEFVCILGPSGCGKSTLLNILSGLDEHYEGSARIHGCPVREQLSAGFRVGYVFQEPRLMPWRTVRESIEFVLDASDFPVSQWQSKIDRCLALVELSDFGEFHPLQLSGGMQQRASIARAFAIEPDILLMDEPFSALDELTARRLRQQLLTIWMVRPFCSSLTTRSRPRSSADRILMMTKGPGRFCDDRRYLLCPRSYEDIQAFDASRNVVRRLFDHVGEPQWPYR